MALSENQVIEIVTGFLSRLQKEIPIREVYLFGSYADGNPKERSDIDIAVISDWFEGKSKMENMQYLSRLAASYNSLVEAIPFTEKEYLNPDNRTFLFHILKTGRKLSGLLEQ